jgi:hypothetical protein
MLSGQIPSGGVAKGAHRSARQGSGGEPAEARPSARTDRESAPRNVAASLTLCLLLSKLTGKREFQLARFQALMP